jgi:hypothetical protein
MKRNPLIRIPISDHQTRYKLTYESLPCEPTAVAGRVEQMHMLQTLTDQPGLCYCGNVPFDTLKVYHNTICWVIEMEAVETHV